jgi:anti-anti-sigma factor
MAKDNKITLETSGDVTLFDIQGDITAFSDPFLKEAYETANSQGTSKIVLKFNQDAYINSGGIAVLIQLLAQTKSKNQQISISGLSEHFKKIFNMVGITKFAKIYDTAEQAVESLSGS